MSEPVCETCRGRGVTENGETCVCLLREALLSYLPAFLRVPGIETSGSWIKSFYPKTKDTSVFFACDRSKFLTVVKTHLISSYIEKSGSYKFLFSSGQELVDLFLSNDKSYWFSEIFKVDLFVLDLSHDIPNKKMPDLVLHAVMGRLDHGLPVWVYVPKIRFNSLVRLYGAEFESLLFSSKFFHIEVNR